MSSSAEATTSWRQLGKRFYRSEELYAMMWKDVDLSRFMVSGARFGGPLALIRDPRKLMVLKGAATAPRLMIFTSAGEQLASVVWQKGTIVCFGWSDEEQLVCVLEDGTVLLYSVFGKLLSQFTLGQAVTQQTVLQACVWGTGLVALTGTYHLWVVNDFTEPRPLQMANTGLASPPRAMAIIEPAYTLSRNVEVLLATQTGTILLVDADTSQDQLLTDGPYTALAVSATGKYLACYTATGVLRVFSADFAQTLSEFDCKRAEPPTQLAWCGTDSVVLAWDKVVLMVGPFSQYTHYEYDGAVHLVTELDGVRIVSSVLHEFLQLVPRSTESIFRIGSMERAAVLLDAMRYFRAGDPKADSMIRRIRPNLAAAVDDCIEAAGFELSYLRQKELLQAASFGKCFLDFHNPDRFVTMCETLRVLNAVRHFTVGIPLSIEQYAQLTPAVLVNRLVNRRFHLLAFRICQFLQMKPDHVLIHWACEKVTRPGSDDDLRDLIVEKLSAVPGISYVDVATTAHATGRPSLAIALLEHEPRAADQVPLLLKLKQQDLALIKAVDSGDTDLVYYVMLDLLGKLDRKAFFNVLRDKPIACALLITYAKQQDLELLKAFFAAVDHVEQIALIALLESQRTDDPTKRNQALDRARSFFADSKQRDYSFQAKAVEEYKQLLAAHVDLEAATKESFSGLSVSETIHKAIRSSEFKRAEKLRSLFKVPDKRWYWIKMAALIESRDFVQLERFAKEKKSPIGYKPFCDRLIKEDAFAEAARYIPRVSDPHTRAELYFEVGSFLEATELAVSLRDRELLEQIRGKCHAPNVLALIDPALAAMKRP